MKLDQANGGPCPPPEILRAILHGSATGACQVAARETGSAYWSRMAEEQRSKSRAHLHQAAALARSPSCAEARTSKVTPNPASFE